MGVRHPITKSLKIYFQVGLQLVGEGAGFFLVNTHKCSVYLFIISSST